MTAACLFLMAGLVGAQDSPSETISDQRCGAYCLFIALRALGEELGRFEEFEASLPKPGPSGYSMDQLSRFAAERGLYTTAVETSLRNLGLRDRGFCCITAILPSHYVLLYDADEKSVFFADPPESNRLPVDGFKAVWTRKCLLISRSPLQREEDLGRMPLLLRILLGAAAVLVVFALAFLIRRASASLRNRASIAAALLLLVSPLSMPGCTNRRRIEAKPTGAALEATPSKIDLGTVWADVGAREKRVRVEVVNRSDRTIKIQSVSGSCACTQVSTDRNALPPHGRTMVNASIRLGDSAEARRSLIYVRTSDLAAPLLTIPVDWRVRSALRALPGSVDATQRSGESRSFELTVELGGLGLCESCSLSAASDGSNLEAKTRLLDLRRVSGHAGSDDPDKTFAIGKLTVRSLPRTLEPADASSVHLALMCKQQVRATLTVPVLVRRHDRVQVLPSAVSLGSTSPGNPRSVTVVIRDTTKRPFGIIKAECSTPGILTGFVPPLELSEKHLLRLELRAPREPGPWRVVLHVVTDAEGPGPIDIPVSGITM